MIGATFALLAPPDETTTGTGAAAQHEPAPSWSDRLGWTLRPAAIFLASRVITFGTLAVCTLFTHAGLSGELNRWDARWFMRAAANGWPRHLAYQHGHVAGSTIAFFPLFPLSIRWLSQVTGLTLVASGVVIASITGLTATIAVWALIRRFADREAADRGTLLLAVFPASFVFSMAYAEGFVITFVALGIMALMDRRWVLAGVLGLLATATAPIAVAFELSCLWCAYRAISRDRNWKALAAPVLTPLGFVAYQVWLWRHTGITDSWRMTERGGWKSYPSLVYPLHIVWAFLRDPVAVTKTGDLLFVGTVVAAAAAVMAIRSRMPAPLLIYGLSAAFFGLISAPVGLRPRFILLAFPLVIAVGIKLRGRSYGAAVGFSAILLVLLTGLTVSSWAVFP